MRNWMVVRRSNLPGGGGYRIIRSRLTEAEAKALAPRYERPHEAMAEATLVDLRMAALSQPRGDEMDDLIGHCSNCGTARLDGERCAGCGLLVVDESKEPDVDLAASAPTITVEDRPDANARVYRHVGCKQPLLLGGSRPDAEWTEPLDDCPFPTEEECRECLQVLPCEVAA